MRSISVGLEKQWAAAIAANKTGAPGEMRSISMMKATDLAAKTPITRLRYLDAFRASAMLTVVIGHWLIMTVANVDGEIIGFSILPNVPGLWPLTWVFQVMPLFFLVGGIAGALSWSRWRNRGGGIAGWLLGRLSRLMTPALVVLGLAVIGALIAVHFGVSQRLVQQAVDAVTMPMWFLVVYLLLILVTPGMYWLHLKFGWRVIAVMIMVVIVGDTIRIAAENQYFAYLNHALAWLIPYQVGFAWQDGTLKMTKTKAWIWLAIGLISMILLTIPGPYPISMIGFGGHHLVNTSPPTVALLALTIFQIGVAWLLAQPVQRLMERYQKLWAIVIAINSVTMTIFVWHMVAALAGALLLNSFDSLPFWFIGTGNWGNPQWWLGRLPWFATLIPILALLVLIFGPLESRTQLRSGKTPTTIEKPHLNGTGLTLAVICCYLILAGGLYWMASSPPGFHGPAVIATGALALVAAGTAIFQILRSIT